MKLKLLYTFSLLFTLSIYNATAQSKKQEPLKVVNYGENIKAPLTAKERSFINETYGDNAEKHVLNNPQRVKDIKNILRNRVYIQEVKNKDLSSLKLLSSLSLFNKNTSSSAFFNPNTFNPLNYGFDFYSRNKSVLYFRVDNTNYLISIKPQHQ